MEYIERMELRQLKLKMVGKSYTYEKCQIECTICPLSYPNNHRQISCHGYEEWYPDEALKSIMTFLKTHEDKYPDLRQ